MQTRPTILQVLPALKSGGVERGTIEISQAITRAGWRSLVASSGGQMIAGVAYSGGEHIQLPLNSKNPLRILYNAHLLMDVIRKYDVSVVHARSRAPAWSAYFAARAMKVPFVTTFHGVYGLSPSIKKAYNKIMVKGDRVIAVSEHVRKHILKYYKCDPNKLELIHRGADLSLFQREKVTPGRLEELAKDWRLPDDHNALIILPGRVTRWKGHEFLIRALYELPRRDFLCILVGDGSEHPNFLEEMKQLIMSLRMEGNIRFAPNTKYMTEAYALADIVAVPSIEPEAFGRVPVEAQAMGKVVIATNHGGAKETILHNETGFLVEPGNIESLVAALNVTLEMSQADREEMGQRGKEHVQRNFSLEVMQNKTLALYQALMQA